jgi:hypothetical protein
MIKFMCIHFPQVLKFLPEKLKKDKAFLFPIIDKNTEAFQYVSESLKKDTEFILSFFNNSYSHINNLEKRYSYIYHTRKRHLLYEYCSIELKENREFLLHLLVEAEKEQNQKILYSLPDKYFHNLEFWVDFLQISTCRLWDISFYKKTLRQSFALQNIKRQANNALNESLLDFFDLDWMKQQVEKNKLEILISEPTKTKTIKL